MEIWNNFTDWLSSSSGQRIVTTMILPFLAIIVAGIIAAIVSSSALKRVVALSDREDKASAINALISAARKAAVWNTLPAPEQAHIEHLIGEADIKLRLLPVVGTSLAADWTSHEIKDMQKNAVSFSFAAEQTLLTFRDRLIEWQAHPGRAKKLFRNDLDSWAYDSSVSEQDVVAQQQAWAAQQAEARSLDAYTAPPETAARPEAATPVAPSAAVPTTPVARPAVVAPAGIAARPAATTEPTTTTEPTAATRVIVPVQAEDSPASPPSVEDRARESDRSPDHVPVIADSTSRDAESRGVEPRDAVGH